MRALLGILLAASCFSPSAAADANITQIIADQMRAFDPSYPVWRAEGLANLTRTRAQLDLWLSKGMPKFCSEQLYAQANTAVIHYANFSLFSLAYSELQQSLVQSEDNQSWAVREMPDGTWGPCYTEGPMLAYNRLDPFINAFNNMADSGGVPVYTPIHALDPWLGNTDSLVNYCREHLVSHISQDGVDNREMLAAVSADLSQMAFKDTLRYLWNTSSGSAPLSQAWVDTWWKFLVQEWQDSTTGTWGARYDTSGDATQSNTASSGTVVQGRDLSMTYHIVSYAHKAHLTVPKLYPEMFNWLLSPEFLLDGVYPYGRLYHGLPCAHNDYDVARLWQRVMPAVPEPAARSRVATWLVNATNHTLQDQLGPDGAFEARMGSLSDAQYFGVQFLVKVGYFNASARTWWAPDYQPGGSAAADRLWPDATETCCRICAAMKRMGMTGGSNNATWLLLGSTCPACGRR